MIKDLPSGFASLREKCLNLACVFAELDEEVQNKYVDESSRYFLLVGAWEGRRLMGKRVSIIACMRQMRKD